MLMRIAGVKNQISVAAVVLSCCLTLFGCFSAPKQTVELAEITDEQIAGLQESHIRFVQLYYDKLREDINDFIDNKWTPSFLSKAVQNEQFRQSLDNAYAASNSDPESAELGMVLLGFSKSALKEINARRTSLLTSINDQEQLVIDEINGAFADLQRSQSAIKGYLASAVNLKTQQDLALKKMGVLEKSRKLTDAVLEKADQLSSLLQSGEDANQVIRQATEVVNQKIQTIVNTADAIQ